ncbi:MAG: hypothetical protein ACJAZO_001747 [Myxococcota bacterium]|jgi:hypothetical protein
MPPKRFYPLGKWFEFRPQLVPHLMAPEAWSPWLTRKHGAVVFIQFSEECALERFHDFSLVIVFMVVAEQVAQAMDHENAHLMHQAVATLVCLALGGRNADDDVTQEIGVSDELAFLLAKGQHVCGGIFAPPIAVERVDDGIVTEQQRHFAMGLV